MARCFLTIVLFCAAGAVWAAELPKYRIADLEAAAVSAHPVIQAWEQKIQGLSGEWAQAGLAPNPVVSYEAEDFSGDAPFGKQGIFVSQEIVTNGKLARARDVACGEIQAAQESLRAARLRVQTDVRIAAIAYLTLQKEQAFLEKYVHLNETVCQYTEKLVERGESSQLALLNQRTELETSRQELEATKNQQQAAWRRLATVMGNPDWPQGELTDSLECTPTVESWEKCLLLLEDANPELARAAANLETANRRLQLEAAKDSTDITVEGGAAYNTEENLIEGRIGVSIPLRIRDRNQGHIAAARSAVIVAQNEYARVQLSLKNRLAMLYAEYKTAAESVQLYSKSILPQTEKLLSLAQSGYNHGELGYLELLNVQVRYAQMHIKYFESLGDYWTQKTTLEGKLLTGCLEESVD